MKKKIEELDSKISGLDTSNFLVYNPETDFYGGINPTTLEWKNIVYAGFKTNDLIRKAWSDTAYVTHNQNGQAVNMSPSTPLIESDRLRIGSSSTGQNGYTSPCYYLLITEPIYINESVVIDFTANAVNNTGNFSTGLFITNTNNLGNITMDGTTGISDNRILVLNRKSDKGEQTWSYTADNLKSLVESKFSDFTIPYYIGFYLSSSWSGSSGYIDVTKLTIGG